MSRVFLFSANTTIEPYPVYPLGMALLAGALAERGHEVRQYDFLAAGENEEGLCREMETFAPDLVGMSLRNIDNVDSFCAENAWYLAQARELVQGIRKTTTAPLVVGGPAFSIMPEEILAYLGADYGIIGEGEQALCRLLDDLAAGRELPALIPAGEPLQGSEMATPLFQPELVDFYLGKSGIINLQTKRGCPYRCSYCTYPQLEGRNFRPRPVKMVADDLERIRRENPEASVFFTDSVFNDPGGYYLELAEEILQRGVIIPWSAFFRPQDLGRKELEVLKRAGLYALELGTDAASDATLAGMDKGFSFADVLRVNEACLAEELPCAHFIIFGGPGETPETVEEGLGNIARLGPSVVFAFSGIRILPGAPLQQQAVTEGIVTADQSLLMPAYYYSPRIDPEAMNAAIEKSFKGRRNRIFPPSEGQARLAVMRKFGFNGILWDKLISFGKKPS
ncbi:MAG: lipid biosynthesis B12-binding/radical SAM protein [Syntrophotaleaceae bacterium]